MMYYEILAESITVTGYEICVDGNVENNRRKEVFTVGLSPMVYPQLT